MSNLVDSLPLVAIVTPVYNGAAYLRTTMESVQAQTYPNLVHIVLDNASTDETPRILDKYRNARVRVEIHRNETVLPLQENWNRAFSFLPPEARYAKLNCADDLIAPSAVERMVALAESDPEIELVLSDDVFDDEVRRSWLDRRKLVHDGRTFLKRMMRDAVGWLPYQHFFVRIRPEDRGDDFCGGLWSQDPFVVVRSASRGKVGYIPEPLVYTRVHAETATSKEVDNGSIRLLMAPLDLWKAALPLLGRDMVEKVTLGTFKREVTRAYVLMRLQRRRRHAEALRCKLRETGVPLDLKSLVSAVADYPWRRLRKMVHERHRCVHMDELHFLGGFPSGKSREALPER